MAKPTAKKAAKPITKKAPVKTAAKKPAPKLVKKSTPAAKKPIAKKPAPAAQKLAPKLVTKKTTSPKTESTLSAAKKIAPKAAAPAPVKAAKPKREYKPAKLPAGYKPTASEEYMNAQQQEYFRQKLLGWRKELMDESRETLDHLHEENWHQADIADRASLETEAGVELRTRNRYLKLISKIDSAIRRIEEGEYGFCEESGEPIGLKRLEARPVATLSIEAQERHERNERQYTDED